MNNLQFIGPFKDKTSQYFDKTIDLYLSAFPENERCPINDFIQNIIDGKNQLFITLVDNEFVGFLTYWNFNNFGYIEHFAVAPETRGKGYGSKILKEIVKYANRSIVLEVELPTNPVAIARISFYSKAGFNIIKKNYIQPAYVCNFDAVDMYLMYNGAKQLSDDEIQNIVDTLYATVYSTSQLPSQPLQ